MSYRTPLIILAVGILHISAISCSEKPTLPDIPATIQAMESANALADKKAIREWENLAGISATVESELASVFKRKETQGPKGLSAVIGPTPNLEVATDSNESVVLSLPAIYPLSEHPWPMYRHDLQLSGTSPYAVASDSTLLWSYHTGIDRFPGGPAGTMPIPSFEMYVPADEIQASPVMDRNGVIYVMGLESANSSDYQAARFAKLVAINMDGSLRWKTSLGKTDRLNITPAVSLNNGIYAGIHSNQCIHARKTWIFLLDDNGGHKWEISCLTSTSDRSGISPTSGGTSLIGSGWISPDGNLLGGQPYSPQSIALSRDSKTIYSSIQEQETLAAYSTEGKLLWHMPIEGLESNPSIGVDDNVYVIAGGKLISIDPEGNLRWRSDHNDLDGGLQPTIPLQGSVLVANKIGTIYRFSTSGQLLQSIELGYPIDSLIVDGNGHLVITGSDTLSLVSVKGQVIWTHHIGPSKVIPIIGADGTIYVGCINNEREFDGICAFGDIRTKENWYTHDLMEPELYTPKIATEVPLTPNNTYTAPTPTLVPTATATPPVKAGVYINGKPCIHDTSVEECSVPEGKSAEFRIVGVQPGAEMISMQLEDMNITPFTPPVADSGGTIKVNIVIPKLSPYLRRQGKNMRIETGLHVGLHFSTMIANKGFDGWLNVKLDEAIPTPVPTPTIWPTFTPSY